MAREHFDFVPARMAAQILGVSECTLARWRAASEGPTYVKLGGRIRYPESALVEYVAGQTCHVGQREVAA